jgi:hypothetical protein
MPEASSSEESFALEAAFARSAAMRSARWSSVIAPTCSIWMGPPFGPVSSESGLRLPSISFSHSLMAATDAALEPIEAMRARLLRIF